MKHCLLCKKNQGDKKGSHIVPHFLLKRIENIDGKKGRDYGLAYSIGEFETESHFERAVPLEKLDETYGPLTEEEIKEKNNHPLIVDNFFCSQCEKKISVVESEYSKTLSKKDNKTYSSNIQSEISLLFWMSVIWRMSINKKSGMSLSKGENEILRRILNRYLKQEIKDIDISHMGTALDLKKISYKILRSPDFSENDSTLLFFDPRYRDPYILLIDEYLVLFSFKSNYKQFSSKEFYSLEKDFTSIPTNKTRSGNEQISFLEENIFININNLVINKIRDVRFKRIEEFLNKLNRSLGKKGLFPAHLKKKIFTEIVSEEKKNGRKYTIADLKNSTMKVLSGN